VSLYSVPDIVDRNAVVICF